MVSPNPLFSSEWRLGKKYRATVINDIWPEVLFFTLIATMVTLVSTQTSHSLGINSQLLTVLGTVLGLVVSFRTSSAYERYQEGRKLWTNIQLTSRNLAQIIWNHIPVDRPDSNDSQSQKGETKDGVPQSGRQLSSVIEKKTMINLIQAFSVAVKHLLRGEPGIYYEDLYPLICFLPRYATHPPELRAYEDVLPLWKASDLDELETNPIPSRPDPLTRSRSTSDPGSVKQPGGNNAEGFVKGHSRDWSSFSPIRTSLRRPRRADTFDPEKALPVVQTDRPLRPARNPPHTSIYTPILLIFRPLIRLFRSITDKSRNQPPVEVTMAGKKVQPSYVDSNVPLEIALFMSSYLSWLLKEKLLEAPIANGMTNAIASLQENAINLERIRNTPLPFAYQAHLRMTMWLYLVFLPFQIFSTMKYLTIPATAFASFMLLGFLEIGQEIENPFNYDLNDLDLDGFCLTIQRELAEVTVHTSPDPGTYIFSAWNQPFAPADRRSAEVMMNDIDHEYHGPELVGVSCIRRTLLKCWEDVDEMTRDHRKIQRQQQYWYTSGL